MRMPWASPTPYLTNPPDSGIMDVGDGNDMDERTAEQRIQDVENSIAQNDYETVVVFDSDGNEVFRQAGSESNVHLSQEQIEQACGNIITHNHPSANSEVPVSVMSSSDIRLDGSALPSSGRMVTRNGQVDIITYTEKFDRGNARLLANRMETIETNYVKTAKAEYIRREIASGDIRRYSGVPGASGMSAAAFNARSPAERAEFIRSVQIERRNNYVSSVQNLLISNGKRYGYVYSTNYQEIR